MTLLSKGIQPVPLPTCWVLEEMKKRACLLQKGQEWTKIPS